MKKYFIYIGFAAAAYAVYCASTRHGSRPQTPATAHVASAQVQSGQAVRPIAVQPVAKAAPHQNAPVPPATALQGTQRDELLHAVDHIAFARKRGITRGAMNDDMQVLAKYGNAALVTIADELQAGNLSADDNATIRRRLGLIDVMGVAASSNTTARALLSQFATSTVDTEKPARLIHMDLVDRMEAFSLWAKVDPQSAMDFVQTVQNKQLKREYIYQLVTGMRLAGVPAADAAERAYQVFGSDDLGPSLAEQKRNYEHENTN